MKVFLLKIDKRLIYLALPNIIMDYGRWTTLVEAFAIVEQCESCLEQHDATDLVSMIIDSSKSRKVPVVVVELAETKVENNLYCWSRGQAGTAMKDCPLKPKHA